MCRTSRHVFKKLGIPNDTCISDQKKIYCIASCFEDSKTVAAIINGTNIVSHTRKKGFYCRLIFSDMFESLFSISPSCQMLWVGHSVVLPQGLLGFVSIGLRAKLLLLESSQIFPASRLPSLSHVFLALSFRVKRHVCIERASGMWYTALSGTCLGWGNSYLCVEKNVCVQCSVFALLHLFAFLTDSALTRLLLLLFLCTVLTEKVKSAHGKKGVLWTYVFL